MFAGDEKHATDQRLLFTTVSTNILNHKINWSKLALLITKCDQLHTVVLLTIVHNQLYYKFKIKYILKLSALSVIR